MKALIIDDSRAMLAILRQMLEANGFEVLQAGHGKDGLAQLTSNPDTSLALVDWYMPEMNGLEMVKAVRENKSLDGLRVIMVTTETEASYVQTAMAAGANEYVKKPFTREVIEEKLKLLGLRQ